MTTPETKEPTCSTREAAELLGIVERTVLLYIARGELQGRRTGRRWHVTRASVEKHPHFGTSADSPPLRPSRSPASVPPRPQRPLPNATASEFAAPLPAKRPRREWSFRNLRVLTELATLASRTTTALADLPTVPPRVIDLALVSAMEAARHGAAGFHAFVAKDKARLYARAREFVAMTAASLWIVADLSADRAEGLRLVAREYEALAPSLGALMRGAHAADA